MAVSFQRFGNRLRLDVVLGLLWLLELIHVAVPAIPLETPLAIAILFYGALALIGLRWQTLLLCLVLVGGALVLAALYDVWPAIFTGARRALIFAAFLPTILLIRATADRRPEIARARSLFNGLDPAQRGAGLLFGLHAIAAILSIGIFALLSSVTDPDAPKEERQRLVGIALRSICLCSLWSPFFVGMGIVTYFIPRVPLWQIMGLGLCFASAGLLLSFAMFDRSGGFGGLVRTLATLTPIVPPIGVAALFIVVTTGATSLSTLEALILTMPVLCLVAMATMRGRHLSGAIRATRLGLGNIRGEVCILAFAVILGAVVEATLPKSGLTAALSEIQPSAIAIIAFVIGAMSLAGLAGFHPMVSLTVLLAMSATIDLPLHDLVLMQALLVGWGFGAMISVSGISIVTASTLFGVPPERLVRGQNILFVTVMGAGATIVLAGLNSIFLMN